tara:strand:- start:191 stop:325 length:135 start_codon:yes stop_codon:yes gene_type:complete
MDNKKWFYRMGVVFFSMATIYLMILCVKAWIWAKWIHRLSDTFN